MGRRLIAMVLAACAITAGCTGSSPGSATDPASVSANVRVAPDGDDAFYRAPAPPAGAKPGDVIWARPLAAPAGSKGYAVLYWSTGLDGALVAVSGVVFQPTAPATRRRPVLAWGHGTFGLGDQCAPTRGYLGGNGASIPLVRAAVQEDLVFAATDYRGLGTPDAHPYLVNQTAGRDILDSIRAAAEITGAGANPDGVVMGQSQGGGAALFAAELQPSYAPDVRLHGSVGVSVPSDLDQLDMQLSGGPYFGYVLMTVDGYRSAYPDLADDDPQLTPAGRLALQQITGQCTDKILGDFSDRQESEFGVRQVLHAPDFSARLAENEPGRSGTPVPIFLVHGEQDDTIPVQNSRDLLAHFCAVGATVTAKIYPGSGHVDVLGAALDDIVRYLRNRLADTPATSSCTPS